MSIFIYVYAIIAGILMFVLLELDKKFIRNNSEESEYYSSLRIATIVSLIIWAICAYQENNFIENVPILKIHSQKILTGDF
jgi:uncharacterized membrane protein